MATSEITVDFLDANVIAKPVTRTLPMIGGVPSGYLAVWSQTAETEAERHLRDRATKPSAVRARYGAELTPTGGVGDRFEATKGADRQILADAIAAGARYLVTEDVDDFAESDLTGVGISAVNPDLFLAERISAKGYAYAVETFVTTQTRPRRTGPQVHAAIAKQHPLLFAAHAGLYDVEPTISPHGPPAVAFVAGAVCGSKRSRTADGTRVGPVRGVSGGSVAQIGSADRGQSDDRPEGRALACA